MGTTYCSVVLPRPNIKNGVLMVAGEKKTEKAEEIVKDVAIEESSKAVSLPKETLDYFNGDEIRSRVFYEKYALKDAEGNTVESLPEQMWDRIAREISGVESEESKKSEWYEKFKWLLRNFRFLPGGRIMFGAGQARKSTLLNCYVIPIKDDSIEAIFDWCKEAARTYSYGGGVGTDISILRPKGAPVNNSAVYSTGATSFMNLFSETTHTIGQHGRRGALMLTMSVDHPDIINFINIKKNVTSVRYANISVKITDEFMRAVEADQEFTLRFGNGVIGRIEKKISARKVWNELVSSARDWAEPGLIFWDTMKRYSPSEYNGMEIVSTNPCSEQPLQPYGACDLGNINLSEFVIDPFGANARLDWETFEKATRYAVRFLDDVLDYNGSKHPLKEQTEAAARSRRIGVGVTGLGDMFVKLKIKYDSQEALDFVDKLFARMTRLAYDASIEIAKEKGSFPLFDSKKHLSMPFIQGLDEEIKEKIGRIGLRNVAILTIPPVGSGSVLAGTSSGIEPIFAFSYTRRSESLSQEYFKVYHPLVLEYMRASGVKEEQELPEFFVPAHKIRPEFRVKMQGVIQRHIDSAISSTVNLSEDTTVEQVGQIYMQAWKAGCKGITVYREGSREGILITDEAQRKKEEKQSQAASKEFNAAGSYGSDEIRAQALEDWERPRLLSGHTIRLNLPQGALYVTANFESNNKLREVFINLGKTGSDEKSYCEAIGRLVSKYLQIGGDVSEVIKSLKGIKANSSISWDRGIKLYSIPDSIGQALEIMSGEKRRLFAVPLAVSEDAAEIAHGQQFSISEPDQPEKGQERGAIQPEICVSCGEKGVVHENGCYVCKICGYTKCD